jgi:hypothetical protein
MKKSKAAAKPTLNSRPAHPRYLRLPVKRKSATQTTTAIANRISRARKNGTRRRRQANAGRANAAGAAAALSNVTTS